MALGDVLARLSVELGLDTAAFTTGSRKAQRANKDLGDSAEAMGRRIGGATKAIAAAGIAVAGAFVVGQLKDLVKGGLEYASALGEQAQQLGVSTRALQEYRFAATQVGISSDEMDAALSKLTRSIGEAEAGSKTQAEAFAKLGISTRDAGGAIKDAGDLLPEIAEKLKGLHSPAERAAVLVDLFGKSGQKLAPLLADGAAGVNGLRDAAQKLGVVLSDEQIQKADETADKLAALNQVLQAKIAAAVADNTGSILALANALVKVVDAAGRAVTAYQRYRLEVGLRNSERVAGGGLFISDEAQASAARQAQRYRDALDNLDNPGRRVVAPGGSTTRPAGPRPTSGFGAPLRLNVGPSGSNGALLRKPGSSRNTFTAGIGPTRFAANDIDIQAGRNTAALAALTQMAASASGAAGALQPVLEKLSAATATTTEEFSKLSPVAQTILDRLFPAEAADREDEAALAALRAELGKGVISLERYEEARRRLSAATLGGDATDGGPGESVFENAEPQEVNLDRISQGLAKFKGLADTTADGVEVANVRVVRSFADTAQAVLGSLQNLTGAIRGGGFLNILSAVIGFGTQLGSAGAFGSGLHNRLTGASVGTPPYVPGYATGTLSARRGLALVGERGPELVSFGGGERVWPNGTGPGGGGRGSTVQVIPSPYFDVVVDGRVVRAAPSIMDGGARIGQARMARAQSRRLA